MISIQENVLLRDYTTFKVGGPAKFFTVVKSVEEVREVFEWAEKQGLGLSAQGFFVLGGGSNILVSDEGFNGLVLKVEIMGVDFWDEKVSVGAGENWDDFVKAVVERGLCGLENLSYIPGTVGGAPVQNIGAYGAEVRSFIESVEAFSLAEKKVVNFTAAQCEFAYRDSYFKKNPGKFVITRVNFKLRKFSETGGGKCVANISYKDLQNYFAGKFPEEIAALTPADVREAVIAIRTKKLPDWRVMGTVGSFFKNPIISGAKYAELKKVYPDLPAYPADRDTDIKKSDNSNDFVKIPLAWILDNVCGYRGKKYSGVVGVYQNQALVIVNDYASESAGIGSSAGQASAAEIAALASEMTACVREKTGIEIEPEAQYLGFKEL